MDEITPRPVNLRPSICNFRPRRTGIGEKGSSTVVVGDGWDMFGMFFFECMVHGTCLLFYCMFVELL